MEPTGNATRETAEQYIKHVREWGFCIIEGVVPPEQVAAVRAEALSGIEEYRTCYESDDPRMRAINQVAFVPSFARYVADDRIMAVCRDVLDPHVRIAQTEYLGKIRPAGEDKKAMEKRMDPAQHGGSRGYHTDWPYDINAGGHSGAIRPPFPPVPMAISTVWYLSDSSQDAAGTWLVPRSHTEPRNPLVVEDGIDNRMPIPGELQATAPAGSVLVMDARLWHSMAPNNAPSPRVAVVVRYAPWWLSVEFGSSAGPFQLSNNAWVPRDIFENMPAAVQLLYRHRVGTVNPDTGVYVHEGERDSIQPLKAAHAKQTGESLRGRSAGELGDNSHVVVGAKL